MVKGHFRCVLLFCGLLLFGTAVPSFSQEALVHYPFSGNANDESGNENNAVVNGAVLAEDRFGNANSAYYFDGIDDYLLAEFDTTLDEGSISYWFKSTSDDSLTVVLAASHFGQFKSDIGIRQPGTVRIWWQSVRQYAPRDAIYSTESFSDGYWHHVVVTKHPGGSGAVKIYIDGAEITDTQVQLDESPGSVVVSRLYIGANAGTDINGVWSSRNRHFEGTIDDVSLFDYALSESEITELCTEGGWSGCTADALAYYPFSGNANDESGNGFDASVIGAALTSDRFGIAASAYSFDGVNDRIDPPAFSTSAVDFSYCSWVRSDSPNPSQVTQMIYGGRSGTTTTLTTFATKTNNSIGIKVQIDGGIADRPTVDTPNDIYDGEWHHLCMTAGADSMKLFLDSELIGSDDTFDAGGSMTTNVFIGAYSDNGSPQHFFLGDLDDIYIFDRTITAAEVLALCTEGGWMCGEPVDTDLDGIPDSEDNCPLVANPGQEDLDGDLIGDVCDDDRDGDGADNIADAFPDDPSEQSDNDSDGIGDNADPDDDNDSFTDDDELACGSDPTSAASVPVGIVSGSVTDTLGVGIAGVLVKLLDYLNPTVVVAEDTTDASGIYAFPEDTAKTYLVMIVEPVGYDVDQQDVEFTPVLPEFCTTPDGPDFVLSELVTTNMARSRAWWRHQFDRVIDGRPAAVTEAELQAWIAEVEDRYTNPYYQTLFDSLNGDLTLWHEVLSRKVWWQYIGNFTELQRVRAESQIAALVLNVMSLRIGQYETISADGHDVADAITYASQLVVDPEGTRPDLSAWGAYVYATLIAARVNLRITLPSGTLPDCASGVFDCDRLYKFDEEGEASPELTFEITTVYPHPVRGEGRIGYSLSESSHVRLTVYDVLGREVKRLIDAPKEAGKHVADITTAELSSGQYLLRLEAGDRSATRTLVAVK